MYGTSPMFTMPVQSAESNNGGMGNSPFMYLVWMWAFAMFGRNGGMFGGNGEGASATSAVTANQIDDIRAGVASIRQGVECGNANAMRSLDQLMNQAAANGLRIDAGFNSVNGNICDTKTALLGALCNIEHGLTVQGMTFANQMQQCCCETKQAIQEVGCGVEKGLLNQTIQLNQGLCNTNANISQVGTSIGNGISALGFNIQQQFCNTNDLIAANTREVQNQGSLTRQLMVDQCKDAEIARLNREINDLSQSRQTLAFEASQLSQTNALENFIRRHNCDCPTSGNGNGNSRPS